MSEGDVIDEQWTGVTSERFRQATEELIDAIRLYGDRVLSMAGRRAEVFELLEVGEMLAEVVSAYSNAHFDFTGTFPSLASDQGEGGEREESDVEIETEQSESGNAVERLSILHRSDFQVIDLEAILQAGRQAYQAMWPNDDEEDAAADVTDLGRALYQIQHRGGISAVSQVPGLQPAGSSTWIVESSDLLGKRTDIEDGIRNPFELRESAIGSAFDHL